MLEIKHKDDLVIATLTGKRFNALIANQVKEELNQVLERKGTKLIIDLINVSFIDSSGFGALISNLKRSKENNSSLYLSNINADVMELIVLMKLDTIFEICTDIDNCTNKAK